MQFLRWKVVRLAALSSLILAASCSSKTQPQLVEAKFKSMGTELHLRVWAADPDAVSTASNKIRSEFNRLENLMSNWREGSDIQKLNAAAGQQAVMLDAELLHLLQTAHQVSEWTGGKFDVTFGVMSGLWKFDYQNEDDSIPDPAEVARRRTLINFHDLIVDEKNGTAFLRRAGMNANLGGIGKGYAVDRARDILHASGFHDFMIQFGGDMYVAGKQGERSWRLGIQDPRGEPGHIFAAMDLSDSTFSSSGDYERFFIKDGRRYHHIIDPATGEPSLGCRSVTIVSGSATIADGLSTGVFIMGPEAGMALIEKLPDIEGVIVSSRNEVLVSSGLKNRLTILAAPSDAP
jgi:thiamine biosynthesis lipoprotein